jgi:hypothetical protein
MRNPSEQLRRIQDAIIKIMQFAKKGRRRFDKEEGDAKLDHLLSSDHW